MPRETFSKPLEDILRGKCSFEYYDYSNDTFTNTKPTRICHVSLEEESEFNKNVVLMVFTIRNQNGKWKIHSEGEKRTDIGSTVPLRNAAVTLAQKNEWKYIAIALAGEDIDDDDIVNKYVVSMESVAYGEITAYDLTNEFIEIEKMGRPDFYRCKARYQDCLLAFIKKDKIVNYLRMCDSRNFPEKVKICSSKDAAENRENGGVNKIFYGIPGAGKSYSIDEIVGSAVSQERIVFHPDYAYSDFVGQIVPKVKSVDDSENNKLTYEFVPGPFTLMLKEAISKPDSMHYLIIEEINRGNAPAIFGDLFQLLDRDESGNSKYYITNEDIAKAVYGDETQKIRIPSNLTIFATMNTSDQNVFSLDTAFQRRWIMKYVDNDVINADHANTNIEGSSITWGSFASTINEEVLEYNEGLASSEDKQLGAYFVKENELVPDIFPEKALKYLWDDAFKLGRYKVFSEEIKSMGDVVKTYRDEIQKHNDPIKRIIRAEVYNRMMGGSVYDDPSDPDGMIEEFSTISTEQED